MVTLPSPNLTQEKGETIADFKQRIRREIELSHYQNVGKCDLQIPRQMRYSCKDDSIESFRKTLRSNKFMHKEYNPNLDSVFGQYLFNGIMTERIVKDDTIQTVNEFILKEKTYKQAIKMSNKEVYKLPLRMKPKRAATKGNNSPRFTIDPEIEANKSRKKLYHFYASKLTDKSFTKNKIKAIEESLKQEMKRHKPKYFREVSNDPEQLQKTYNRKNQAGYFEVDPAEEKQRQQIILKAKLRLVVKKTDDTDKPKRNNLRDLIALQKKMTSKINNADELPTIEELELMKIPSKFSHERKRRSPKKQVAFLDQNTLVKANQTQMFDSLSPKIKEEANGLQFIPKRILKNANTTIIDHRRQLNIDSERQTQDLSQSIKRLESGHSIINDDSPRKFSSVLINAQTKQPEQNQIIITSMQNLQSKDEQNLHSSGKQQRKRIGTARQRNSQSFFSQEMKAKHGGQENTSVQSPNAATTMDSNGQFSSSIRVQNNQHENQAMSGQYLIMNSSLGQNCLKDEKYGSCKKYLDSLQVQFEDWNERHHKIQYATGEYLEELRYSSNEEVKGIEEILAYKEQEDREGFKNKENLDSYKDDMIATTKFLNNDKGGRKIWQPEKLTVPRYTYLGQIIAQQSQ
ncbi:UNKNOWN [Stylonychia lemnae]|uniref:Uncharacterized protein n=1 Tax=Stylonychia lemnae TaxID=5949 RepID=A0A078AAL5_STYLE|nr:UNKNOWN [Stylonychia lemnae]|eukprot:CDW79320.1 UNKNOWN [Stylonychia lemnae]